MLKTLYSAYHGPVQKRLILVHILKAYDAVSGMLCGRWKNYVHSSLRSHSHKLAGEISKRGKFTTRMKAVSSELCLASIVLQLRLWLPPSLQSTPLCPLDPSDLCVWASSLLQNKMLKSSDCICACFSPTISTSSPLPMSLTPTQLQHLVLCPSHTRCTIKFCSWT